MLGTFEGKRRRGQQRIRCLDIITESIDINLSKLQDFPHGSKWGKKTYLPMQKTLEMQVWSLRQEDPLEEGVTTHSSILAWRIPWTEEPGKL